MNWIFEMCLTYIKIDQSSNDDKNIFTSFTKLWNFFVTFCLPQTFMCVIFRYGTYHVMNCPSLWFITYYRILCSFKFTCYIYSFYAKSCKGLNDCCQILWLCCHVNSWKNECNDIILIRSVLSFLPLFLFNKQKVFLL